MSTIDNLHQLRQWQPPYRPDAIIGEGLLLPGTVMMLFGAGGVWKTMNSTHLAFCIGRGSKWFDFETSPSAVLMHQSELPKLLMRDRIIKYADGMNVACDNVFFKTPEEEVLLDTTWGLQSLTKDIEEIIKRAEPGLPIVVIIDPLNTYMAGHTSDEFEVRKFQRNINSLRRKFNVTFIIVHHARKRRVDSGGNVVDLGDEELMGSGYWKAWLDTIVRVQLTNPYSGADTVHMSFDKHRNAWNFLPGFTVKWHRENLVPEIIDRDVISDAEPTIRGLT